MFVIDRSKKLVDLLVREGKLKKEVADSWRSLSNFEVEQKLKSEKMVSSEDIGRTYAELYNLPFVSLKGCRIDQTILNLIPYEIAQKFQIVAYELTKNAVQPNNPYTQIIGLAVAAPDKLSSDATTVLTSLERKKHLKIQLAVTTPEDLTQILTQYKKEGTFQSQPMSQPMPIKPPPVQSIPTLTPAPPSPPAPEPPPPPVHKLSLTNPIVNLRTIDLDKIQIPYEVVCKFPEDIARKYKMIVFEAPHPSFIKVAVSDPYDKKIREILDFVKEKNDIAIQEFITTSDQIFRAMKYYKKPAPPPPQKPALPPVKSVVQEKEKLQEESPVAKPAVVPSVETAAEKKAPKRFVLKPKPKPQESEAKEETRPPTPQVEEQEGKIVQMASQINDLDEFLGQPVKSVEDFQAIAETGHVPKIVAAAIALAVLKKASDIHIEPEEKDLRVRFRVDGILKDIIRLPLSMQPAILSRIKIVSKLKIDEIRIPQDGRFDVVTNKHAIDLRVSTLPTVRGEKAALRILDKSAHLYTLEELGLSGRNLKVVIDNIDKPYGVVLATGPTGSGKSTTLYAILNRISNASINIVTLEDPVEYEVPGINQCQIKPKIGFTFANGLRSVLRQDPNIIMVGEIRDAETASLATHAALTGHLVLSSLHTNDAAGALPRMINMDVEPFLITSSINVIIAQRLVRKLCPKCVRPARIPEPIVKEIEEELKGFNLPTPYQFLEGKGCENCENGYSGRLGIFEVLAMTDSIENMVISRKPASEIKEVGIKEGMITMKQDGLMKALKGETSVNEVLRVITV